MHCSVLISGGGIGGMAAALAAAQASCRVRLFEKAPAFSDVGAGIQLGPNATRVLHGLGLTSALKKLAAAPDTLTIRSSDTGSTLGTLRLGADMLARYGAPYYTVHRADLHALLLKALPRDGVAVKLSCPLQSVTQTQASVRVQTNTGQLIDGDVLVAADGLWSPLRAQLLGDGPPRLTGHLAYRALVLQGSLPPYLRSANITAWMGRNMHVVIYPVRAGQAMNIVAIVHGKVSGDQTSWNHSALAADLKTHLVDSHGDLRDLLDHIDSTAWRLWTLHDRPPMQGAHQLSQGRVALLGDAAHPMRPYLAQGACMAIEDAEALGHVLKNCPPQSVPSALQRYAQARWQRNARVQARALRNGEIFHADGPMRWGRDTAMKLLGGKLLDLPWLYGYRQTL